MRNIRVIEGLIVITLIAIVLIIWRDMTSLEVASGPEFWFEELANPVAIDATSGAVLARFAATGFPLGKPRPEIFPAALSQDAAPRIVFLSTGNIAQRPEQVAFGTGRGFQTAIERALLKLAARRDDSYRPTWLKLDIVKDSRVIPAFDFNKALPLVDKLEGLAFDKSSALAFLPEELLTHGLVNEAGRISIDTIADYLQHRPAAAQQFTRLQASDGVSAHRFGVMSFLIDARGAR